MHNEKYYFFWGGRWSIIEAIILEVFKGSEITVKVYEL